MSYERITTADLERALVAHRDMLARHGLMPEGYELGLDRGSKTYGRAYRLYLVGTDRSIEGWSGHRRPPGIGEDFLGMTAREAYDRLTERTRIIGDTIHQLEQVNQ